MGDRCDFSEFTASGRIDYHVIAPDQSVKAIWIEIIDFGCLAKPHSNYLWHRDFILYLRGWLWEASP